MGDSVLEHTFQDDCDYVGGEKIFRLLRVCMFKRSSNILPLLRLCQYLKSKKGKLNYVFYKLCIRRYAILCDCYNVSIPIETRIGKGCCFPHYFPIVINPMSVIGENCIIHPCVLIGRDRGKVGAPVIGDNCFIGHGAKIVGNPCIGSWSFISPGAIVTKSVPCGSLVGSGVNNILSDKGKEHVMLYLR